MKQNITTQNGGSRTRWLVAVHVKDAPAQSSLVVYAMAQADCIDAFMVIKSRRARTAL